MRIRSHRSRPAAFSLVELLVVLGIISLLIGILLPVTAKARREARKTACKAQLANVGAAMQMYLNENDGWYPLACYSPTFNPNNLPQVNTLLQRYVSNVNEVFHCPADETYFQQYGLSYSYYSELGIRRIRQTFFFKILRSASETPVLWDAENFHGGTVPYNWLYADGHVGQFLAPTKDWTIQQPGP